MKLVMHKFEVSGILQFPIDMLRYDCCYPADSESVAKIHALLDPSCRLMERKALGPVTLTKVALPYWQPTHDRWMSFGYATKYIGNHSL